MKWLSGRSRRARGEVAAHNGTTPVRREGWRTRATEAELAFPLLGPRVALRPFSPDDGRAAHQIYADPEVMRWVGHGAVTSYAATESIIRQYITHQQLHGFAFWAVTDRRTGEIIGDAGLARTADGAVEMGYTLRKDRWGEGLGTETAGVCIEAAHTLGIPRVRALVEAPNVASRRVLEKLGFERDGTTLAFGRPHLVYRRTP
ncbi:MAG: GNAT family N-acetyltransferase [Patulibacter sp.]